MLPRRVFYMSNHNSSRVTVHSVRFLKSGVDAASVELNLSFYQCWLRVASHLSLRLFVFFLVMKLQPDSVGKWVLLVEKWQVYLIFIFENQKMLLFQHVSTLRQEPFVTERFDLVDVKRPFLAHGLVENRRWGVPECSIPSLLYFPSVTSCSEIRTYVMNFSHHFCLELELANRHSSHLAVV